MCIPNEQELLITFLLYRLIILPPLTMEKEINLISLKKNLAYGRRPIANNKIFGESIIELRSSFKPLLKKTSQKLKVMRYAVVRKYIIAVVWQSQVKHA